MLERIQSKRHQLETAESVGVPVPRTLHPGSAEEAVAAGEELGFPLIVKPSANVGFRRSHKRQLFRCETPAELERAYRACRERIWQDLQVEPAPETIRIYHQLTGASVRRSALTRVERTSPARLSILK